MSYYWFNRQEILQKAKEKHSKKKKRSKVSCTKQRSYKKNSRGNYKNLSQEGRKNQD